MKNFVCFENAIKRWLKSLTHRCSMWAVVLAALSVKTANAADINVVISQEQTLATIRNNIHNAVIAAGSGYTVTVTGSRTGVVTNMSLEIPAGVTIRWQAEYSGNAGAAQGAMLAFQGFGSGTFRLASGGSITQTGNAIAIQCDGLDVVIDGGAINAADVAIYTPYNVRVGGGTVGGTIWANGNVTVEGGSVSRASSVVIDAGGNVTVSGGTVSGGSIMEGMIRSGGNVTVSGSAQVSGTTGEAIIAVGNVTVGNNARVSTTASSASRNAISATGAGSAVTVSGNASVSATGGSAIRVSGANATVNVSGGDVSNAGSSATYPTIDVSNASNTAENVVVSGTGKVRSTAAGVNAIQTSGGARLEGNAQVSATTGYAIRAASVAVNGGAAFAYGTGSAGVIWGGGVFAGPAANGIVVAWNQAAGRTAYAEGTDIDISLQQQTGTATAVWGSDNLLRGIVYQNNAVSGFFQVAGVTLGGDLAPEATDVSVNTTAPDIGDAITGSYNYVVGSGAGAGSESGSTFKWYRSNSSTFNANATEIPGATEPTYTPTGADWTRYLYFEVTPTNGSLAGTPVRSTASGQVGIWINFEVNANGTTGMARLDGVQWAPVTFRRTMIQETLSTYSSLTSVVWTASRGRFDNPGQSNATYRYPTMDESVTGGITITATFTPEGSTLPTATSVNANAAEPVVGAPLTASYNYNAGTGIGAGNESGSMLKWYRSTSASFTAAAREIPGATEQTYTPTGADVGAYLYFEVTPSNGTLHGVSVRSAASGRTGIMVNLAVNDNGTTGSATINGDALPVRFVSAAATPLEVAATFGDAASVAWSATAGTFADASAENPGYALPVMNATLTEPITITATFRGVTSASVANVTVGGFTGMELSPQTAVITLTNETVDDAGLADHPAADWFAPSNLPSGITATATASPGGRSITIAFGGAPTAVSSAPFDVTIPASVLTNGENIAVTANPDAKFAIVATTYGVSLSQSGAYNFASAAEGYTAQSPRSVTINNTGNQPTGALTVALTGAHAGSFALSATSIGSIAVAGNAGFTVVPNTGLGAGTYTATVTVSGGNGISASFTVNFEVIPTYTVTVENGSGSGEYVAGATVTITANPPSSGKAFDVWVSGDGVDFADENAANTTFEMPVKAVTVTATYKDLPPDTYSITVLTDGNGAANADVTSAAAGGTQITLTATPDEGYRFATWVVQTSHAASLLTDATANPATFTMPDEDVVIRATFEEIPQQPTTYTISIGTFANGSVSASPSAPSAAGTPITLTIAPALNYELEAISAHKTGEATTSVTLSGTGDTREFDMPEFDVTVVATFKSQSVPACEHQWGAWTVITAATCEADGEEERTCSLCDEKETRKIDKLTEGCGVPACEHQWGAWTVTTAATCEADGKEERTCSLCGEKEIREIDKLTEGCGGVTNVPELAAPENPLRAYVRGRLLHITGIAVDETLSIYTSSGVLVHQSKPNNTEIDINLTTQGVYIIQSGGNTVRVVIN